MAGRGRKGPYGPPPAQIPASGITAPGSCLGSGAQPLLTAVSGRTHFAGLPVSAYGPCFALPVSPWPVPFPPHPPPPLLTPVPAPRLSGCALLPAVFAPVLLLLCSGDSSVLWNCPTSRSRISRLCPFRVFRAVHFAISTWTRPGPPASRVKSFHACMGSLTPPSPGAPRACGAPVLPSVCQKYVGAQNCFAHFEAQYPACISPCQRFGYGVTAIQA